MPTAVQRLFRACRDVFSDGGTGVVPSPEEVDRIRTVLDKMKLTDLNISPSMPYFDDAYVAKGAYPKPPVTYLHVYECDKFSIGIFCLPPSSVIPLHNHPGMTVFSKLLFGSMHIKSYDWVDTPQEPGECTDHILAQPPGVRLAKMVTDTVFTAPCSTSILYPNSGGNMHCFTGMTACAVLDVLGPPYDDAEGRHCQYYHVYPFSSFAGDATSTPVHGEEYAWLEEREKPEDFIVLGGKYMGPKIVVR